MRRLIYEDLKYKGYVYVREQRHFIIIIYLRLDNVQCTHLRYLHLQNSPRTRSHSTLAFQATPYYYFELKYFNHFYALESDAKRARHD